MASILGSKTKNASTGSVLWNSKPSDSGASSISTPQIDLSDPIGLASKKLGVPKTKPDTQGLDITRNIAMDIDRKNNPHLKVSDVRDNPNKNLNNKTKQISGEVGIKTLDLLGRAGNSTVNAVKQSGAFKQPEVFQGKDGKKYITEKQDNRSFPQKIKDTGKGFVKGLTGKERPDSLEAFGYSKKDIESFNKKMPIPTKAAEFSSGIILDPTTYVGVGTGRNILKKFTGKSEIKNTLIDTEKEVKKLLDIESANNALKNSKLIRKNTQSFGKPLIHKTQYKPFTFNEPGRFTIKNKALDNAKNDLYNAIEVVQNHYGTNSLRVDEMKRIKPELGIDLDGLANKVSVLEGKTQSQVFEDAVNKSRLRRAAGLGSDKSYRIMQNASLQPNKRISPKLEPKLMPESKIKPDLLEDMVNVKNSKSILPNRKTGVQEAAKTIENVSPTIDATTLKDVSGFNANTNDIYRIFKKVYGDKFDIAKKEILDPFDAAKKSNIQMQNRLLSELKNDIVDKFGIKKGSKESALVQMFGEKKITLDELKQKAPQNWENIVEADKWFRNQYDTLLDKVNESMRVVYPNNPEKIIPKRADYYRHFRELNDTITGVKNLFDTPAQINPSLAGISDFTTPKSRFLSFAQKRGLGPYKNDAVGGFISYVRPASYATNINPEISKFRGLAKNLATQTEESKNINNFIEYLNDFSNSLAGKTNSFDRPFQKVIGRKAMNVINWTNSRVKANTILGNVSSTLAQLANVPSGVAYVKNPVHLTEGAADTIKSIINKNNPMKDSGFLMERYGDKLYRQFDTRWIDQPKKFAAWLLEVGDEIGTKFIWNSVYRKGLAEGSQDAVKYADDVTRSLVAGRGIGETPLIQQSKIFQVVAPFQLEVGNLWRVMGDMVKDKDFGGLATLFVANYILNRAMEQVRGSGATFDPIKAMQDALMEKDTDPLQKAGRIGGEILSNIPLGQTVASQFPDNVRKKYFGKEDPARFGSGLVATRGLQDPVFKLLPSFGGSQIKKTIEGNRALNKGGVYNGDKLKYPVNNNTVNRIKGTLFGKSGFRETKEFYNKNRRELGSKQTAAFNELVSQGYEPKKLYELKMDIRRIDSMKEKMNNIAKDPNLSDEQKRKRIQIIYEEFKPLNDKLQAIEGN